jgi:hypothetical protein
LPIFKEEEAKFTTRQPIPSMNKTKDNPAPWLASIMNKPVALNIADYRGPVQNRADL